jgi:hypothetical protein
MREYNTRYRISRETINSVEQEFIDRLGYYQGQEKLHFKHLINQLNGYLCCYLWVLL